MRGYTQLVHEQRYQIYSLMKAGLNQTEIAENIGVHKSTISREVRRNQGQKATALNRRIVSRNLASLTVPGGIFLTVPGKQ